MGSSIAIAGQELFDRAEAGEALAQKHVDQTLDSLGRGIQMIAVALNPDRILLGGAISEREGLLEDVTQRAQAYLERTQAKDIELDIVICKFRNQANLIGAVSAHYSQIKQ
ncbi:ROK family protein [Fundicoccus ignavus]|uniref:ROK family protein n=1 Tax=Fundicoccus ignavus TaxID=2664442 RepID=UPI003459E950